ncbi:30S ribosomal protein S7 [bacterium]|nr:30S ribosomal protein S7 [bacterium]
MPRDPRKVVKRTPGPDPVYGSTLVSKFINNIMRRGKKSLAQRLFYKSLAIVEERTGGEPIKTFEKALQNVLPTLEVKSRRLGGATYQVPIEVRPERRYALAMRWIITAAKARGGKDFPSKLAAELIDAANNAGASTKKRDDTHKMAEANKAFASFRW